VSAVLWLVILIYIEVKMFKDVVTVMDKLRHPRTVAYSVELVLLNKLQILGGGADLECYQRCLTLGMLCKLWPLVAYKISGTLLLSQRLSPWWFPHRVQIGKPSTFGLEVQGHQGEFLTGLGYVSEPG